MVYNLKRMSGLSETDTEFYLRDRDSFSSTGTGIEEPVPE